MFETLKFRWDKTHNRSIARICSTRERFNDAIEHQDVTSIRTFLAPSYHIVTGRSAQNHGAEAEAARWAETFRADPTVVYRRTPYKIILNEAWGLAEELGNWLGSYTAGGVHVRASGVYAAKWQCAENGDWHLQAEVFTTLSCTGPDSGCVKPDPITN